MSLFFRSILVRSRSVLRPSFPKKSPCVLRRLGVVEISALCRPSTTSASVSCARPHPKVVEQDVQYDPEPTRELTSPTNPGVKYEAKESQYYHQFMENSPLYKDTIFARKDLESLIISDIENVDHLLQTEDWNHACTSEIVDAFRTLTSYARANGLVISDPQFDNICSAISGRFKEFADDEMIEIGKLHTLWLFPPTSTEKNYELLRQSLDDFYCLRYTDEWFRTRNYTKILQAADTLYWQRWGAKSHFLRLMIYHLGTKTQEHHHMIQIMFYLGLMKQIPDTFKMYDLEKRIFSFRNQCSLPELAIVANSLFRTKSRLQYYPLMQEFLVKSLKSFSLLDDFLLTTISKGCNEAPQELKPLVALLQKRLTSNFNNFGMVAIIHAMWIFVKCGVIEEDFAQLVYDKSLSNFSNLRTKELTRIMIMFTELESSERDLKNLGEKLLAELEISQKQEWFQKKEFITGGVLHRLLLCGICPHDRVNEYLNFVNQRSVSSHSKIVGDKSTEALGIDVHLEVFYPNYTGTRLKPDLREAIYKYRFENCSDKFVKSCGTKGKRSSFNLKRVQSIEDSLLKVLDGRKDYMLVKQLVPSFGYIDVVLRISQEGLFLPIPEEMKLSERWEITKIPRQHIEDGDRFLALTFIGQSYEYTSKKISCFQREKKMILQSLGYRHEDVPIDNWIRATSPQQQTNLKTIISNALKK